MYQTLFDEFKATCQRVGVTQSGQVSKMIKQFVEANREI
nr:MAG TPA: antitoxin [Caudoviricetes sp.]